MQLEIGLSYGCPTWTHRQPPGRAEVAPLSHPFFWQRARNTLHFRPFVTETSPGDLFASSPSTSEGAA